MRSRSVWRVLLMIGALALLAAAMPISAASAAVYDPDPAEITLNGTETQPLHFVGATTPQQAWAWGDDNDDTWALTVATQCEAKVHIEWFDSYPTQDVYELWVDGALASVNEAGATGQADVWLDVGVHTIVVDWIYYKTDQPLIPGGSYYDITFEVTDQTDCADQPTTSCPPGQLFVDSHGTPTVPVAAATGYPYDLTVEGTYYANGTFLYDIQADAEYSRDAYQRVNGLPWTDSVRNYEGYGEGLLEMKVDGGFVEWGAFAPDHSYTIPWMATGSVIDFQIYDLNSGNNNIGGLCVDVEPVAKRSVSGGGQIIEEIGPKPKDDLKVSFGGHLDDIDGGLVCEWQVNLHNVGDDALDGSKFHATRCEDLETPLNDNADPKTPVATFWAFGTFNGADAKAYFALEDAGEPGTMDAVRIRLFDEYGTRIYQTTPGDFDKDPVSTPRTLLDRGNIQIDFYE